MDHDKNNACTPNPSPEATDEFARGAAVWPSSGAVGDASRRAFLKRMAAALALAGVGEWAVGCSERPTHEKLVPRVAGDGGSTPGIATRFATALPLSGYGRGVLVTSREGRPIKIEGNPDHPSSLGGTDVFAQASILDLYDPTRSQSPTFGGAATSWSAFFESLNSRLTSIRAARGEGLRVLSGTITSPTLVAQIASLETSMPEARWHTFDPLTPENAFAGTTLAFGRPLEAVYSFDQAKVILSLDADFLFEMPGSMRYARDFIDGRRVRDGSSPMNRLYVAEPALSLTGSMADHRLTLRPDEIESLACEVDRACRGGATPTDAAATRRSAWINAVAADLLAHRGESLVIAGASQPPHVHAVAAALNHALGNLGATVRFIEPIAFGVSDAKRSLAALVEDCSRGEVEALIILGDNPAYTAPADLAFADALARLSAARLVDGSLAHLTAHLGQRSDATSFCCQWHLPQTHPLEQWGDIHGHDGTVSIVQPLIAPLYGGRSAHELIDRIIGVTDRSDYETVRAYWRSMLGDKSFESAWASALQKGIIDRTAAPSISTDTPQTQTTDVASVPHDLEVIFRPDPSAWDGSFAHNGWLQELPRPFTKLVWDNAAILSAATARVHGLADGDCVRLTLDSRSIELPVLILAGTADGVVMVHLGYGQRGSDAADAEIVGVSAYAIRPGTRRSEKIAATLEKIGGRVALVQTRSHHAMESGEQGGRSTDAVVTPQSPADEIFNRRIVRIATIGELQRAPDIVQQLGGERERRPLLSLYPDTNPAEGFQWGMSIDQTACIGCNACVVACQAENNIPIVGKEQVSRQREMHWLRIDDYLAGDAANPQVVHQPVPCMHCENAPCEVVCPVAATTHSVEGLNQMTYNRCVGTRYCSNNCPYKVRRFNFLDYTHSVRESPQRRLLQNPEVTVRAGGVMEKCTYCVQRLQQTRIDVDRVRLDLHERARRASDDGTKASLVAEADTRAFEMLDRLDTACAQACPTRAIAFGSVTHITGRRTRVMDAKSLPTDYTLLAELTTKPRTSYRARITNPNPALDAQGGGA